MERTNYSNNNNSQINNKEVLDIKEVIGSKGYDEEFPIIDENIEDVSKSTLHYIKEHYLPHSFFLIILSIFLIVLSFSSGIFYFIFFPLAIIIGAYSYVQKKIKHAFMQQFAMANNYHYREQGSLEEIGAPYLQMGHSRYIEDIVNGTYKGCPIKFFNFYCTIGHGKNQQHISFTVCEIHYKTSLPRIFLDAHHHSLLTQDIFASFKNEEILSLEGDFNKYFTLYVPKGYEIEALQIFAPDVMAKLIDKSKLFSLEFIGDHLYIYSSRPIETKNGLYELYELVRILVVELAPVLERLK
jgi:hypothetical protein